VAHRFASIAFTTGLVMARCARKSSTFFEVVKLARAAHESGGFEFASECGTRFGRERHLVFAKGQRPTEAPHMTRGSVTSSSSPHSISPVGFAGGVLRVAGAPCRARGDSAVRPNARVAASGSAQSVATTASAQLMTTARPMPERASVPMRKACEVAATNANQRASG